MNSNPASSTGPSPVEADPNAKTPTRAAKPRRARSPAWTVDDAAELYQINGWGQGFFGVNERGHVVVRPKKEDGAEIDLYEVVTGARERGLSTPLIVGFSDLLATRIRELHGAFASAISEYVYQGRYCAVYPIKVNQQQHVVEEVRAYGAEHGFGLEVGSKPELLAVLGMTSDANDRPIICNGFKEDRYVEFVTLAAKLGRTIIPVVENHGELQRVLDMAERYEVRPRVGIRVNLSAQGAGRWRHSSGAKAKFGLTISGVLEALKFLQARGMQSCLELLHCHLGSQIHDIRSINNGVHELARIYCELARMGAGVKYLDIGGGLGVDYDGSQTNFEFSTNYTLQEYASNVVYRIMSVCDEADVPHPTIVTESGRAMVAHHSVLVFDVLGSTRHDRHGITDEISSIDIDDEQVPRPVIDLLEAYNNVSERRLIEAYHDAIQAREEAITMFNVGYLTLEQRDVVDRLFWATCSRIHAKCRHLENVPEELEDLDENLCDTYFCNLSIFRSLPDVWAINQIFPVVPIQRLDERPLRRAVLADLTCDSDGRIDRFVDLRDIKHALELHELENGEPYYLAAFLVGAYQETLGDLHNLFGDTHVVHVKLDENGKWWMDQIIEGDTIREVLSYVQYDAHSLFQAIRRECEHAVRAGTMSVAESRALVQAYEGGLSGYTYLE